MVDRTIDILKQLVEVSDQVAAGARGNLKPFLRLLAFLVVCIVFILALPIIPFVGMFRSRNQGLSIARSKFGEMWQHGDPQKAVLQLRQLHAELKEERHQNKPLEIKPYGSFKPETDYPLISDTLYKWEIALHNWKQAEDVCDDMISGKEDSSGTVWHVRKAQCMLKHRSQSQVIEWMLPHQDPTNPSAPVNVYLKELLDKRAI